MSLFIAVVALIASLHSVHGSTCDAGFCSVDDAASLLQVNQQVVIPQRPSSPSGDLALTQLHDEHSKVGITQGPPSASGDLVLTQIHDEHSKVGITQGPPSPSADLVMTQLHDEHSKVEEGRARLHGHDHTGRMFWQCKAHKCLSVLQSGIDDGVQQDFKQYIDFTPLTVLKDVEPSNVEHAEWHGKDYRCTETWKTTAIKQPSWTKQALSPLKSSGQVTSIKIGETRYGQFVAGQMKCMRWRSKLNKPDKDVEDSCKCWMHKFRGNTLVKDAFEKNWQHGVPPLSDFAGGNNLIVPSQLTKKLPTGQEVPESAPQKEKSFNPMDPEPMRMSGAYPEEP